jgi:hypothetical protein
MAREFASIAASAEPPGTRHWINGEPAARPLVVILETTTDGTFLFRYAADGTFAGDTWHIDVDDARDQATYEFGEA